MPYNTRRKSLSLADLGVVLPKRSRAPSHPSPPSTIAEGEESERPAKISKTSHASSSTSSSSPPPARKTMSPPRSTLVRIKEETPKQELSPPPSPTTETAPRVNLEGLSDDIVIATIRQLETTGNRPIFVRELAAVLATRLHSVEKSANPSALISSRLTAYLNRSWPTISPCPLAKDLSPVHPRRLYFYLTTMPRQPVPDAMDQVMKPARIISPSLSSASVADEEDERYARNQRALSPSPEVDLSSPELDDEDSREPPTPGAPFSGRNSVARSRAASTSNLNHNRRAASPQLESEEQDFKQTASALYEQAQQQRRNSQQEESADNSNSSVQAEEAPTSPERVVEETEETTARKHSEYAADIFGHADHLKPVGPALELFSSPLIEPQQNLRIDTSLSKPVRIDEPMEDLNLDLSKDLGVPLDWDTLQSPENVELSELEDMFDAY